MNPEFGGPVKSDKVWFYAAIGTGAQFAPRRDLSQCQPDGYTFVPDLVAGITHCGKFLGTAE